MNNTRQTKTFIGATMLASATAAGYAAFMSHSWHAQLALAILVLAAATSRLKVKLPGLEGNMSVNLPFLLTAVASLSAAEVLTITAVSTVVQCWPKKNGQFKPQQMMFNVSMMLFATSLASLIFHAHGLGAAQVGPLALAAVALFLGQTVPVAGIIAVSEQKNAGSVWWNLAHLSFPYYVVSAGLTSMIQVMSTHLGWALALAVFPVMYGVFRSYRVYFGQMAETLRPVVLVKTAVAGA